MSKSKPSSQNEIIKQVAALFGCNLAQAKRYLMSFASLIAEELRSNGVMNLPQVGRFTKHVQNPHKGRNPKTGAKVDVPAKTRVLFKAKKTLIDKIGGKNKGQKNLP
jgi:DNA-binding protein HU-beta